MKAVHFGAGNIGRGFIGEVLAANDFDITFVDLNDTIIDALQERQSYEIEFADENHARVQVENVTGVNNQKNPEQVVEAIKDADIVTTAIGPNILPFIAELIAQGLLARKKNKVVQPIDVLACENMIGGSTFLQEKVAEYIPTADVDYIDQYVGFPNAAVDRIVPIQENEDPLFVSVEPFKEWVIDETQMKAKDIRLDGALYVDDLQPYIERKLFSVNTGHATVAYSGAYKGYPTIDEALTDSDVLDLLTRVLSETGQLLVDKWGFDAEDHKKYTGKIIQRFKNPYISDVVTRVGRTPIRKLGYDERFIRPMREAKERDLPYNALLEVVGLIFHFDNPADEQSVELLAKIKEGNTLDVVKEVTQLEDESLIKEIGQSIEKYKK